MIKLYRHEIVELPKRISDTQRIRSEIGKELIRKAAKELFGKEDVTVLKTEHGKPYFADIPLKFSVSHSEGLVILAVSDREIGADVQYMAPRTVDISSRFFTEREQEYVSGDIARFYEIWTKKEAYAKWKGVALADCLDTDVTSLVFYTEKYGEYAISIYEK